MDKKIYFTDGSCPECNFDLSENFTEYKLLTQIVECPRCNSKLKALGTDEIYIEKENDSYIMWEFEMYE